MSRLQAPPDSAVAERHPVRAFRVEWWLRAFSRSPLRTRLFLNLLPFVVILLAVGVYALALFSRLANSVDATVTKNYRSMQAVEAMSRALAGMKGDARNAVVTGNADGKAFAEYQKQFETNLALQVQNATLPDEKELNGRLAAQYDAFQKDRAALRPVRSPKDQQDDYERTLVSRAGKMEALLEEVRSLNYRAVQTASQDIRAVNRTVSRLMLTGLVIVLVVSAYACYQLSRSILQPILLLTRATRELGAGNLHQPVPVVSRDELAELAVSFNKMAAQLQEYRQSTTEEIVRLHRTMETTLASFPDPIFVLNKEGQIELRNPAAAEMASSLHLKQELPARLQTITTRTLANGTNYLPHSFNDVVSFRIGGADKFFLPRILAMRNKDRTLFGAAVVLYDVTRFRLLDAAKTDLVATVSHELKTPLTSVRMALHLLLEKTVGALTPKQDELLQAARNDTERLLRMLNDLLDLARLDEGNTELRKEKVAPVELWQGVMRETADKVLAKGLTMNCQVDPDLPAVLVDRQRINHVFTNLITNAIKHSPAGGQIVLRAVLTEDNSVEFSVTDQGPGIAEEYHNRIFDRFFRVPGQTRPGAGLGLSIAREITVAHGGRIGVRSSPGRGSTFYVILKALSGAL